MTNSLPYGRQSIEEDDIAAVSSALHADFLTTGPLVAEFEKQFAHATGANHVVVCNSGTAALHLAVMGLGLGPGDAAIVPSLTFVSTANVVRFTGAEVIFADVDAETGLITPQTLQDALGKAKRVGRIKAVLPVHLNGQVCDMPELSEVARANEIEIVEDACHALGVKDIGATKFARAACFSTHPVKAIATGEGGVVTTADAAMAEHMRRLRSHGIDRDADGFSNKELGFSGGAVNPWYYEMVELSWNYRMPDILCALGISQLRKLPRFFARRKAIAAIYDRLLAPLSPALRPVPHNRGEHGWHLYPVLIDFAAVGMTRAAFMNALRADGIGTQVHYLPLHWQPYYRRRYGSLALPGSDAYYARCLSLPMFPAMTNKDIERVVGSVSRLIARA